VPNIGFIEKEGLPMPTFALCFRVVFLMCCFQKKWVGHYHKKRSDLRLWWLPNIGKKGRRMCKVVAKRLFLLAGFGS
jgi:hypothetical protein